MPVITILRLALRGSFVLMLVATLGAQPTGAVTHCAIDDEKSCFGWDDPYPANSLRCNLMGLGCATCETDPSGTFHVYNVNNEPVNSASGYSNDAGL